MGIVSAKEHQERVKESQAELDRLLMERDRVDAAIERQEQWHDRRKEAAARAGLADVRRSRLSPLEKSRIIQEIGADEYLALPW